MATTTEQQPSPETQRVAVTGSSGLIGSALLPRLEREGYGVVRLVRRRPQPGSADVFWDPDGGQVDAAALEGVHAVVHLAGENVGSRWTEEKKRRIRHSRVEATHLLCQALAKLQRPPEVLVAASAVGIYGNRGDERLTEESPPGSDFLAGVVRDWEGATRAASDAGIRVANLRFGVVLSAKGGALEKLLTPFRLGAGGPVGSGRQWMAWLSRADAVEIIVRALKDGAVRGGVNAVAGAVTTAELARTLGRVLHRPALVPVPAFALRLMFGEMADETLLTSQRVEPRRLEQLGHSFHHPDLESALRAGIAEG